MKDEITVSPAQFSEIRPAMEQFAQAQQLLIRSARIIIAGAGENPDRYSGNIIVREDGSAVIPLAPILAEVAPNRAERRRKEKTEKSAPVEAQG